MQAVNQCGHSHRAPRQLPKVVAPARHLPTASQVPEFPGSCSPFSPQSLFPWQTPSVCQALFGDLKVVNPLRATRQPVLDDHLFAGSTHTGQG
jgi:hypothetical protein